MISYFKNKLNVVRREGKDMNPKKNATMFPIKIANKSMDKVPNKLFVLKYHW